MTSSEDTLFSVDSKYHFFVYFIVIYLIYYSLCVHVTCMICMLCMPYVDLAVPSSFTWFLSKTQAVCQVWMASASAFSPWVNLWAPLPRVFLMRKMWTCKYSKELVLWRQVIISDAPTNQKINKQKNPKTSSSDHLGKGKKWVFPITPDRTWLNEYHDFPIFSLQNFERTYFYCSKSFNLWYFLMIKWLRS